MIPLDTDTLKHQAAKVLANNVTEIDIEQLFEFKKTTINERLHNYQYFHVDYKFTITADFDRIIIQQERQCSIRGLYQAGISRDIESIDTIAQVLHAFGALQEKYLVSDQFKNSVVQRMSISKWTAEENVSSTSVSQAFNNQ